MTSSPLIRALVACSTGIALVAASPSIATAAEWTSLALGPLTGSVATVAHRPDGRFIFGSNGELYTQTTFGSATKTKANRDALTFDPSFIAVRSDAEVLIGVGGFGSSGLHLYNPLAPAAVVSATALATLQNYACVFWHSPTTSREGWLVGGGNGSAGTYVNKHTITFVSPTGTTTGAITGDLCDYSGGIALDSAGNLYAALSEDFTSLDFVDNKQVLKFTAAQIEAAIIGIETTTPAPIAKASGAVIFTADNSASIAVDSLNRIWAAGYETSTLQLFDPATSVMRRIVPEHPSLAKAAGPPSYAVQTFTRNGAGYVSCVASDSQSYLSNGSALYLAYKPVTAYDVKPEFAPVQSFPTARVGADFSYQLVLAPGSMQGTLRFVPHGLPPGLNFDAATGVISGKPTAAGEYAEVWFTVTNAAGVAQSLSYIINVQDFAPAALGTFVGLYDRALASTSGLGARLDLTTTIAGKYTGKLTLGRSSFSISGPLNTNSSLITGSSTIKRKGLSDLLLNFNIDTTTGALSGALDDGTAPSISPNATLSGWRVQSATTQVGLHNFAALINGVIPASQPQGSSFGSIKITAAAKATIAGRTADGSVFTSASCLGIDGQVLVYQALYTALGTFSGVLSVAADTQHSITGAMSWSHPPQTKGTSYIAGWAGALNLTAHGGKYRPVSGSSIVLSLPSGVTNNAKLTIADGGIETIVTPSPVYAMRIQSPAKVTIAAPQKLSIVNATGEVKATLIAGTGANQRTLAACGLIIPDTSTPDPFDGKGEGYFLVTPVGETQQRSGKVALSGN